MAKFVYRAIKEVAVNGLKLTEATQKELRELYEAGDHRFIAKEETKAKPKDDEATAE